MLLDIESKDLIPVEIPNKLYLELFDCEVDPAHNDDLPGSHRQFSRSMISAVQKINGSWEVEFNEESLIYLINFALPTCMEMWYSWDTEEGQELINEAKIILDSFGIYYPY